MPSGRQSLQDKEPPAQDSCHGVATEVQKCSCSLSWPPALAAIREPTLCGVPRTARCPFVEAGLRFRHLQLKTLRISMDGAYLRKSTASTATKMRICGTIWIMTRPSRSCGSEPPGPDFPDPEEKSSS